MLYMFIIHKYLVQFVKKKMQIRIKFTKSQMYEYFQMLNIVPILHAYVL